MTATRTPARRLVAVLLLSLVAVLTPISGPAAAAATPAASAGSDLVPAVAGPPSALPGRHAPGPVLDDRTTPAGHPGPVLDTLLLAPPEAPVTGPAGTAVDRSATAGLDPGHGSTADPRGPPEA